MAITKEQREFFEDVMTIAVEGGIGYWSELTDLQRHPQSAGQSRYLCVTSFTGHPINEDGEKDGDTFHIDAEAIERAIGRLANDPSIQIAPDIRGGILAGFATLDAGDIDATDADCIVQIAALGEIVYG